MIVLRILRALVLALVMAALLAIVGSIIAPEDQENVFSSLFFIIGLIGFFILLLKADRVGFWFCLCFAIEWALLPIAAAINTTQSVKETGCASVAAAIGTAVLLAITIPMGAIGFILFLLLALFVFRKKKPRSTQTTAVPPSEP